MIKKSLICLFCMFVFSVNAQAVGDDVVKCDAKAQKAAIQFYYLNYNAVIKSASFGIDRVEGDAEYGFTDVYNVHLTVDYSTEGQPTTTNHSPIEVRLYRDGCTIEQITQLGAD